jgi:tRNA threonylcarbamoyladenosine biosynthesis protein TsaB
LEVTLLAIDTSTLQAGVALWSDGRARAERCRTVTTHSEALLAMIDEVFAEAGVRPAELQAIVCGAGPGSFTGLRIGLATAKGLCFALGKPLVMVSSLAALAARAPGGRVCATLDAFKGEVYAGIFDIVDGLPVPAGAEAVLPPAALLTQLGDVTWIVGSGAAKYPQLATAGARLLDDEAGPRPSDLARLGASRAARADYDDLSTAAPAYIRPSEAELVKQQRAR